MRNEGTYPPQEGTEKRPAGRGYAEVAAGQAAQPPPVWQGFAASAGLADAVFVEPLAVLEYPSAYQPPPFNWKELMDISFFTGA